MSFTFWEPNTPIYRTPTPEAIPVLVELLRDPDARARAMACKCLYRLGPAARQPLIALAENDSDSSVRQVAVELLLVINRSRDAYD
jgi:HEAT repeat protein